MNNSFASKNQKIMNKSSQNKFNSFNYLSNLSSKTMENIKLIVDFLEKNENNLNLINELNQNKNSKIINNKSDNPLPFKKKKTLKNIIIDKNVQNRKNSFTMNNYSSMKSYEYEKDESSVDTQITQKEKKIKKKRIGSVENKISNRLYKPFLEKCLYIRKLNKNMSDIQSESLQFSKTIFSISKKQKEEKKNIKSNDVI